MKDTELIECLEKVSAPLMKELVERQYRVRLDDKHSASGVPVFIVTRRPKVVMD